MILSAASVTPETAARVKQNERGNAMQQAIVISHNISLEIPNKNIFPL